MKVRDLIEFLNMFDKDSEIEIEILEIYKTVTHEQVDTTATVSISDIQETLEPVFQIDIEAGKFKKFL